MGTAIITLPAATGTTAGDVPIRLFKLLNAMVLARMKEAEALTPDLGWVERVANQSESELAMDTLVQQFTEAEKAKEDQKKKLASLKEFRAKVPELLREISKASPGSAEPALRAAREQLDKRIKEHVLTEKEWRQGLTVIDGLIKLVTPGATPPARRTAARAGKARK